MRHHRPIRPRAAAPHARSGRRLGTVAVAAAVAIATAGAWSAAEPAPVAAEVGDAHFIDVTRTAPGPLGSVSFIGDSVGIGAGRWAPTLADHLAGLGWGPIRFHAVDGKRTGFPPGWPDHFNAVPMIDEWQASGWDSDVWIVNLGANDSGYCGSDVACARNSIMLVVEAIGPGHEIWWPKITRLYTHSAQEDAWNTALDQIAAERDDVTTWDWPALMRSRPDLYPSWDGTHLFPDGYRLRSAAIADAMTDDLAHASRVGPDAPLPAAAGAASGLVVGAPERVLDTRVDPPGRLDAGAVVRVDLTGHVPDEATAAAVNLTAARTGGRGFLGARPCDASVGGTSSLNVDGANRAAPVVVPLDAGHAFCVDTSVSTDLVVDLQAAFVPVADPGALRMTPLARPERLLDTRRTGRALEHVLTIPEDPDAAAVNVTLANAPVGTFATVRPCGDAGRDPGTSNVNAGPGAPIAASAFVPVVDGTVCVSTSAPVDVIVDLTATFRADGRLAFVPATPTRLLDTRIAIGGWSPLHGAGDELDVRVAPPGAAAVTGTVTVVRPSRQGFVSGVPCGAPVATSAVNAGAGATVANAITVAIDSDGRVCLTSSARAHTLFDVTGWWTP